MPSAFAFGLRGGADPVTCSTLGWSAILWLTRVQRGDVCIGLGVQWIGLGVHWSTVYAEVGSIRNQWKAADHHPLNSHPPAEGGRASCCQQQCSAHHEQLSADKPA